MIPETSLDFQPTTLIYIPEDRSFHVAVFYGEFCTFKSTMFNAELRMKSVHDWFTIRGTLKAWVCTESNDLGEVKVLWRFLDCFGASTRRNIYG
jgi:hypothetical protein